jgi:hypothetical protein
MRSRRCLLAIFAIAVVPALTGCGSATNNGVSVIREWAQALRAGNVDKAASYFALPGIVQNGTPPLRITTRRQARLFNEFLPCGALLIATARHGAYIDATFRLTNRVGGECRTGVGALARTAFLIRNGKIAEWLRLPNAGGGPQTPPAPGQQPVV